MYLYETHLHTYPVSRCAGATVREVLEFYKEIGCCLEGLIYCSRVLAV